MAEYRGFDILDYIVLIVKWGKIFSGDFPNFNSCSVFIYIFSN